MADNLNYQLPGAGENQLPVSTDELLISGVLAHLQRVKIGLGPNNTYQRDLQTGQDTMGNSLPVAIANDQSAIPVRNAGPELPKRSHTSFGSISPGSSVDLDSLSVSTGRTGHLEAILVTASVSVKAVVQSVVDGIPTVVAVGMTGSDRSWDWKTPGRGYVTATASLIAGLDGFRIVVTSLEPCSDAVDVYASFFWFEE
jgi:hypothetical protein